MYEDPIAQLIYETGKSGDKAAFAKLYERFDAEIVAQLDSISEASPDDLTTAACQAVFVYYIDLFDKIDIASGCKNVDEFVVRVNSAMMPSLENTLTFPCKQGDCGGKVNLQGG